MPGLAGGTDRAPLSLLTGAWGMQSCMGGVGGGEVEWKDFTLAEVEYSL